MKAKMSGVLIILVLSVLAVGGVAARGQSPAQLSRSGWSCFNAGPDNYVHCTLPGAGASGATMSVKVFETTNVSATEAEYLGTELLVHKNRYNEQPCPQNGLETYEYLGFVPYFACHHYDTDHH